MQENFYKEHLYPLQNKVLKLIGKSNTDFYLSGGTVLSRIYLQHRYSDDLDFFMNMSGTFKEQTNRIIGNLKETFTDLSPNIIDDTFVRIFIHDKEAELKVEFINDVPFHSGGFEETEIYHKTDNWKNILSNKICALSRDEAKDYADIIYLSHKYNFIWEDIINDAKQKDLWVNEIDVARYIDEFNIERFDSIKWITIPEYENLKKILKVIAEDILMGRNNNINSKFNL